MSLVDWAVVAAYLVWIVWSGIRKTHSTDELEGYFLAKRSLPWWAVGLSVMATQLSAITLVGTTGQGYADGMRFVQFYFGLPIAMITPHDRPRDIRNRRLARARVLLSNRFSRNSYAV